MTPASGSRRLAPLGPALALGAVPLAVPALAAGPAAAPAASTCRVSLAVKPARVSPGARVTLTARAVGCDRLNEIVSDKPVAGTTRHPCRGGSTCTVVVSSSRAALVRFTAKATDGGRTVSSPPVAVRWSAPSSGTGAKPKTFTLTIKDAGGRTAFKAVQTLATYKTVFTGAGEDGDAPNQVRLAGGSTITISAAYDVPLAAGSSVNVTESIWHPETSASDYRTRCQTSSAGKTGCSVKLTLGHAAPLSCCQSFEGHGSITRGPGSDGPPAWITAQVVLVEPKS